MEGFISNWPKWLRWILLLPAALIGGLLAGLIIILGSSYLAESSVAPIHYIAEFFGFTLSTLAALHIAFVFAPSHKRTVTVILILTAIAGSLSVVHLILQAHAYKELCGLIGTLVACLIGFKVYFWDERRQTSNSNKLAGNNTTIISASNEPIEERIGSILGVIWGVLFTIGILFAVGSMLVALLNRL